MRRSDFLVFGWFFAGLLAIATICDRLQPRVYESTGVLQMVVPPTAIVSEGGGYRDLLSEKPPSVGQVDFQRIAQQISSTTLEAFLKPYGYGPDADEAIIVGVLKSNVSITRIPKTCLFKISYRHPDARVALQIDELVMDECIARYARVRHDEHTQDIRILEIRVKQLTREMEDVAGEMEAKRVILEQMSASARDAAKAYNEELERRHLQIKGYVDILTQRMQKKMKEADAMESPLRILDGPVLAGPDDYVRSPTMQVLRWKWAIAGIGGLGAVVVSRFILSRRKHLTIP